METACQRHFQKTCAKARISISKEARSHQQVLKLFSSAKSMPHWYVVIRTNWRSKGLSARGRARIAVLERIPIYPGALGLFTKRVSPAFREYVIGKVPLHDHPRGRQLLEVMQTGSIGRFPG